MIFIESEDISLQELSLDLSLAATKYSNRQLGSSATLYMCYSNMQCAVQQCTILNRSTIAFDAAGQGTSNNNTLGLWAYACSIICSAAVQITRSTKHKITSIFCYVCAYTTRTSTVYA